MSTFTAGKSAHCFARPSPMNATDFEYRHQLLVHQFIVATAFLTYLIQPDDVVWRFVRNRAAPHPLERSLFIVATLFIAVGAGVCTWARACQKVRGASEAGPYRYLRHPRYLGDLVYAIGLGSLAPLTGFVVLVGGEALRLLRLTRREEGREALRQKPVLRVSRPGGVEEPLLWKTAFRREVVKWGVVITMIVFVITLKDRIAEILLLVSFLIGLLLNPPFVSREECG